MKYLKALRSFLREFDKINEQALTGRRLPQPRSASRAGQ
jgi:hypothetical protein